MNIKNSEQVSVILSKQNSCVTVFESDRCRIDLIYFKQCCDYNSSDIEKKYLNVMHTHSLYELHAVIEGEMEITFEDGRTINMQKNHFVLIPPSVKHSITKESVGFKKILVSFELTSLKNNDDDFYVNVIKLMRNPALYKSTPRMIKLFNIMLDIKKSDMHDKNNMIFELAVCYIIEMCNAVIKNNDLKKNEFIPDKRVEAAIKFINDNISVPITTSDVAKAVYISPKQLGRVFNEHLGQSPATYIKMEKNKYVCKLLTETNMGLSDIAESVGYPDTASLIKRFKSIEGITPAKYRLAIKKNKY